MLQIDVINSLSDSYIYVINNGDKCIVVDPGEYRVLQQYLKDKQIKQVDVLITHHHWDHVNGLIGLYQDYPDLKIHTSKEIFGQIKFENGFAIPEANLDPIEPNSEFILQGERFFALDTPGHTKYHLTYFTANAMFVGDLLFSCGCGRVLDDGDLLELYISIDKIKTYAIEMHEKTDELLMFSAHEYTLDNILFAYALNDPTTKPRLEALHAEVVERLNKGFGNTPVNFYNELSYNPFLRCTGPEQFARVRTAKDHFKEILAAAQAQVKQDKEAAAV